MQYKIIKSILPVLALIIAGNTQAQKPQAREMHIPMDEEHWEFDSGTVKFLTTDGRRALKINDGMHLVTLKKTNFSNGVIEFDIQPPSEGFSSVHFRQQSTEERECLYFRTGKNRNEQADDIIQYAPFIAGINLWDLLPEYQSDASIKPDRWNHVKMVISGKQMRVYVNDTWRPALIVPCLEGNTQSGAIAFDGKSLISNLVIKPGVIEGLSSSPGADITDNDPRYLRKWKFSKDKIDLKPGIDFDFSNLPDSNTLWVPIQAERRGLINLTRKFGGGRTRKMVWLKTMIHADSAINKKLRLGFSDEVWVFINGQFLYSDKNYFNTPTMKVPDGRISLENTSFDLPLKKGDNEILIAVVNAFYGWGIIAHLDDNKGILMDK